MKKIGVVTFHRADNYGAVLQDYATVFFLKENGFNVETIDYRNKKIETPYKVNPYCISINNYLNHSREYNDLKAFVNYDYDSFKKIQKNPLSIG